MPVVLLASFPNSRNKPRNPRTTGFTDQITIPSLATVSIAAENQHRTDLNIRNLSTTSPIRFAYTAVAIATEGFVLEPLETIYIDGPQEVFVYNPSGAPLDIVKDEGFG